MTTSERLWEARPTWARMADRWEAHIGTVKEAWSTQLCLCNDGSKSSFRRRCPPLLHLAVYFQKSSNDVILSWFSLKTDRAFIWRFFWQCDRILTYEDFSLLDRVVATKNIWEVFGWVQVNSLCGEQKKRGWPKFYLLNTKADYTRPLSPLRRLLYVLLTKADWYLSWSTFEWECTVLLVAHNVTWGPRLS